MSSADGPGITRRRLLAGAAAGGVAAFLAACGASGPTPAPTASTSPSASTATASPSAAATPSPSAIAAPSPSPSPTVDLRRKIAGLLIVGFRGATLDAAPWVRAAVRDGLLGVVLFDRDQLTGKSRNVTSPAQVTRLIRDLHEIVADRVVTVAIDQEGGIVTRLSPAHGFPPLASEATVGRGTAAAARAWARGLAATLAEVGVNLDFAPVVDLDVNPDSPAIGALGRSFSADPDVVVEMATIEIDALHQKGIRYTLKHFPGIGSSTTNTDFGVADVTDTWTRTELEPFRRLIAAGEADLVMAGHVVNRNLDPDRPASLSKAVVTDLLRGELGWDGVVVTDDLQAAAITENFGADEALLLALEAGNDVLLLANQQVYDAHVVAKAVDAIAAAVASGRIPEARIDEAWGRVQRTLGGTTG